MRRIFASLLLSLAIATPAAHAQTQGQAQPQAPAPVRQIFLAHAQPHNPDRDPVAAAADEFRTQVRALSDGRLTVEIFPESILGGNRQMAGLAESGVVHTALVTVGGVAPVYPPLMVTQLPFAFDQIVTARAVLDGPFGQELAADMAARTPLGLLAFVDPGGFHVLTNSARPILLPEHMAGLRLRAIPGFKPLDAMIQAVKAVPVQVSSQDEMGMMAARMVDGQMSPAPVTLGRNFDTVQPYVTLLNHLYSPYVWVINTAFLASLPPEDAEIVRRAAQLGKARAEALNDEINRSERGVMGLSKRMQVHDLTPAERIAFRDIMQPPVEAAIAAALGERDAGWMEKFKAAAKPAP
jgi:TRAP-type C4-dicarboxylate transport system substrate-binding protein